MGSRSDPANACAGPSETGTKEEGNNASTLAIGRIQPLHRENGMKIRRIWPVALGCAALAAASIAAASNFTTAAHSDFYSAGRHQFYVWCGGAGDHMAIESGKDAEDAQLRLYEQAKAAGQTSCWPVWQGRIAG